MDPYRDIAYQMYSALISTEYRMTELITEHQAILREFERILLNSPVSPETNEGYFSHKSPKNSTKQSES